MRDRVTIDRRSLERISELDRQVGEARDVLFRAHLATGGGSREPTLAPSGEVDADHVGARFASAV